jgi:hypothetical protein
MEDNHDSKPQEWVSRVLAAVGVEVTDKDAYWLGFHMERFLAYCLKQGSSGFSHGRTGYKAYLQQEEPRMWTDELESKKRMLSVIG